MSRKFLTPIDLNTNELQNAVLQNLSSDPTGVAGRIYFNTSSGLKFYGSGTWNTVLTGSNTVTIGTTGIALGSSSTTLAGLTSVTSTVFTGALTGNASTATTLATARTINGVSFDGSANITVKSSTTNALTIGTGLLGTSFDGSSAVTITIDSTVATLSGAQTLSNKVFNTANNTFSINGTQITAVSGSGATVALTTGPSFSGTISAASATFSGTVTVPTPVNGTDAANKNYVDNAVAGLKWKAAANLLATSNIPLTGSTSTVTIDGHATLTSTHSGYRLVLTAQTTGTDNGIYTYTDNGTTYTLARSSDAATYQQLIGATIFIEEGTNYANTAWTQSNTYLTSFASQSWVQFSGASSITAGAGLVRNGNAFDAVGTSNRITVNADSIDIAATYVGQTSITTLGTVATGTWNGTAVAVAYGGTGATTAAGARTNLGATTKVTGTNTLGTSFSVNHALGQWVTAQIFDTTTGALVDCDITNASTSGGTTTFTFASSQTAGALTYVIIG